MKEISDLGLVAGLVTLGYSIKSKHKDGRRVVFTFEWDDNMESLKEDYFNGRMDVDARAFHLTLKGVKQSIYEMTD